MKRAGFTIPILLRVLVLNLLVLFLPVASLLYLKTYELQLLDALEHALVQQGRLLSAALASGAGDLEAEATEILINLAGRHEARLRLVDAEGRLLADTSRLGPTAVAVPPKEGRYPAPASSRAEESLLYRSSTLPVRIYRRYLKAPDPPLESAEFYSGADRLAGEEIRAALDGRYGAATRISLGDRPSVTLYSAIPVRRDDAVVGAVLVSQSTFRILTDLYELRLDILTIFLLSLATAIGLSLLAGLTITRPLQRLSAAALIALDPSDQTAGDDAFFPFQRRRDEIGDLARSLARSAARLKRHITFIDSFAADVAHEIKNPAASILSAAELALTMRGEEDQAFFLERIVLETRRIVETIEGMRELSTLDARMEQEGAQAVDLGELLQSAVAEWRHRYPHPFTLTLAPTRMSVLGSAPRLRQAVAACVENAVSFSDLTAPIELELRQKDDKGAWAELTLSDTGPGIPPENRRKVFERFFSAREEPAQHHGLGLAIAATIIEIHGGTVNAEARSDGRRGAVLRIRLPRIPF